MLDVTKLLVRVKEFHSVDAVKLHSMQRTPGGWLLVLTTEWTSSFRSQQGTTDRAVFFSAKDGEEPKLETSIIV